MRKECTIKGLLILGAFICCGCVSNSVSTPDNRNEATVEANTPEENTGEKEQGEGTSDIWEWIIDDKWFGYITVETKGEFLDHFMGEGAAEEEPFYIFYGKESAWENIEGKVQLELYYNEAEEVICGIRYIYSQDGQLERMEGFASLEVAESDQPWSYPEKEVYSVQRDNSDGSEFVDNYEENCEYNAAGQPVHFESTGNLIDYREDTDPSTIIQIDFCYRADGTLSRKDSFYNTGIWGTTRCDVHEYFDEQERLVYERSYVTHGSLEYYYIYLEDSEIPAYALMLDNIHGTGLVPVFTKRES